MTIFDPAAGVPIALAMRIATIGAALAAARRRTVAYRLAFIGAVAASAVSGATAAAVLAGDPSVHGTLLLHRATGFALTYNVDGLSAWFLLVLSLIAAPIAVFSIGYVGHPHFIRQSVFLGVAFNVLVGALELVFASDGVIGFLFAWELFTLVTAALVATEHHERTNRRAAGLYLVMSHVGTGCLIAGFLVLSAAARSLAFPVIFAGNVVSGPLRDGLFALFFVGFGVKAGIIPFHVWLPEAHPAAPTNISALMSAVLIKGGIYGIVRVCVFGLGVPRLSWGVFTVAMGALSALLGVLYALMQHDLKRLLAYHSIENIGIILLGIGAGMTGLAYGRSDVAFIGIAASLYHVLNHAVFKTLLFLGTGGIVMTTGSRQIEALGGLLRHMPWTGLFFLTGAMAISGLPPLNGFASEWLTFQAFLAGFRGSVEPLIYILFSLAAAMLALTTALAAACFVKAFGISFLALPRSRAAADARESPAVVLVPQAILAALCVALGFVPGVVLRVLGTATASLPGLQPRPDAVAGSLGMMAGLESFDHVVPVTLAVAIAAALLLARGVAGRIPFPRRVPTWGCGGELSAQTEYTATAFSKPLMMIFRAVYRPTREVEALAGVSAYFPQEVRYRASIEPTFERYVYGPLLRRIMRIADAMKVVQAGSLHAYLAYVIALVISLVLLVWWRG